MLFKLMKYYWRTILSILFILILLGISLSSTLITYERAILTAYEELDKQWRTGFDLLISPNKQESTLEIEAVQKTNLIRRSDLGTQRGGISLELYEQIKKIEGVEVAAPISFIGYIPADVMKLKYKLEDEGFYFTESEMKVFDGQRYRENGMRNSTLFQYSKTEQMPMNFVDGKLDLSEYFNQGGWLINNDGEVNLQARENYYWSLIAVDPTEEKKLLSIDQAIVDGEYLPTQEELLSTQHEKLIPLILLNQTYDTISMNKIYKINIDPQLSNKDISLLGGKSYLDRLPRTIMDQIEYNPFSKEFLFYHGDLYFHNQKFQKESNSQLGGLGLYYMNELEPITHEYRGEWNGLPLYEAVPVNVNENFILYRNSNRTSPDNKMTKGIIFDVFGNFDPQKLHYQYSTNDNPVSPEYYNPEKVQLTHDTVGIALSQPIEYQSSPYKDGYHTGGVDAVTTLLGAQYILGDNPISLIRVVVDGIGERSSSSIAKVESVAQEIRDRTGLHVDVMLGAADHKVRVLLADYEGVPGLGYLLEGWTQEGASFAIENQVDTTNLLLGVYVLLLAVLGLLLIYRNYSELRRKEIAIQFTFGWTKNKIVYSLLKEAWMILLFTLVMLFLYKGTLGTDWEWKSFLISMLGVIGIYIFSILLSFILPIINNLAFQVNLRTDGNRYTQLFVKYPGNSIWSFIRNSLFRNMMRTSFKFLVFYISTIYIFLFLSTKATTARFLDVTFLGESINLLLEPYQWLVFGIGIVLSIGCLTVLYIQQIEKRVFEIQLFKAWGWHPIRWIFIYIIEEMLICITSVLLGIVSGYSIFNIFASNYEFNLSFFVLVIAASSMFSVFLFLFSLLIRTKKSRLREF